MDIFGATFPCQCGRTHTVPPERVIYRDAVADVLAETLAPHAPGRAACILADDRTHEVAGADAAKALTSAGWQVREVCVPDDHGHAPVCDDRTRDALAGQVWADADVLLAVGSGVVNDLTKWLAFEAGKPYAVLATAASMNGYTSANVAPAIDGVKTLVSAAAPVAVLADPAVIAAAPRELTTAGLGDALAKPISSADWRMNHLLFGDYYCPRSVALIGEIEPLYLANPEGVTGGEPGAVRALFEALCLTGAAMTLAESSAPASGGEHLVSHSLDMLASIDGTAHDLHGRQVGVGTTLAAEVYQRVLAIESPRWVAPDGQIDRVLWGPLADVVAGHYANKQPRLRQAYEQLRTGDAWDRLRSDLAGMLRPAGAFAECLRRAGGATQAEHLGIGRERLTTALAHGHEIRSRFTCLDLARLAGVLPGAAGEIVRQWA